MPQTSLPPQERYSDAELEEFKVIILHKIAQAQEMIDSLSAQISQNKAYDGTSGGREFNDMIDASASHAQRAEVNRLINRQRDFITKLNNALLRIDNKTYGICRATGKLIPKERLRVVPHATLSVEGKLKK